MSQDLAALAAQYGGAPVSGPAPPTVDPSTGTAPSSALLDLARQHGGSLPGDAPVATFKQTDTSPNELDPNTLGTFVQHVWDNLNPANLAKLVPLPKAMYGSGLDNPLFHVLENAEKVRQQANKEWDAGHKGRAMIRYFDSVIPLLGPMMSHWSDQLDQGKYAAVAGDAVGFGGSMAVPAALGAVSDLAKGAPGASGPAAALSAPEAAANAFGEARGVPLDAATKTGSPFVRGVQKVAGESMLGAPSIAGSRAAQAGALERVGSELAADVHPAPVTPEQAGAGVEGSIRSVMRDLHTKASDAYGTLRDLESKATPDQVPLPKAPVDAIPDWQKAQLRRIVHEMDAETFQRGSYVSEIENNTGHYAKGSSNAEVYHDIKDRGGAANLSGSEIRGEIDDYLGGGPQTQSVKAALEVAKKRATGVPGEVSRPAMGPNEMQRPTAAETARATSGEMPLAVDLTEAKQAIRPMYDRLKQENSIAPLQGGKADALRALDRVINGPDHAPLSVAESALGDLKTLARADDPQLRTAAQGIAGKAVENLSSAIDLRAAGAGDEVYDALKAGRAATRGKYAAADVLDQLRDEPVQLFKQMTAPKDSAIGLLRQVQKVAPDQMPALGRAKLEEWLDMATERGRFDHADKLYAEWNKLGPETKRILFGKADTIANLDRFFLLAKRIGENPNPSGTAPTLLKTGELTGALTHPFVSIPASLTLGATAKLLYSPKGVRALTRVLETSTAAPVRAGARVAGRAASQAAWIDLANVAKSMGVPLELPKAADTDPTR